MAAMIGGARDKVGHVVRHVIPTALLLLGSAAPARAEWTLAAYFGASFTRPANLRVAHGSASTAALDVHFDGRSFASPPYYGYRAGWQSHGPFGLEAELIHMKVYAHSADLPPNVERFSISHGLNLLLGNVTWRTNERQRTRFEARAGAGVAIPHGESEVGGVTQEQYEVSSLAMQGSAGVGVRFTPHLRAFGEYKLTTAAPSVSISGGHISGRYTSQHVAVGVVWNFNDAYSSESERQQQAFRRSRD